MHRNSIFQELFEERPLCLALQTTDSYSQILNAQTLRLTEMTKNETLKLDLDCDDNPHLSAHLLAVLLLQITPHDFSQQVESAKLASAQISIQIFRFSLL